MGAGQAYRVSYRVLLMLKISFVYGYDGDSIKSFCNSRSIVFSRLCVMFVHRSTGFLVPFFFQSFNSEENYYGSPFVLVASSSTPLFSICFGSSSASQTSVGQVAGDSFRKTVNSSELRKLCGCNFCGMRPRSSSCLLLSCQVFCYADKPFRF